MITAKTLPGLLHESAAAYPARVAIESASGATSLSYRAFANAAKQGAGALRARGLTRGDRVLLVMDGRPEFPIALFSILLADLVPVPLPSSVPAEMLALAAMYTSARACLVAETCPVHLAIPVMTSSDLARGPAVDAPSDAAPDDVAVLVFTSGSTARPRAVELTHANIVGNLSAVVSGHNAEPDEALLSVLPPSHVFELVVGLLGPIAVGARIVYAASPLPNRIVGALRERSITRAMLVPALLDALCRDVIQSLVDEGILDVECRRKSPSELAKCLAFMPIDRRQKMVAAVRERIGPSFGRIGMGGAALDPAWTRVLAAAGVDIEIGYGLTEAGPLVSRGLAAEIPQGSVGRPLPGVQVRVGDRDEILVRGAGVMRGYFRDPAGSIAALDGDWLRTGDRGRIDHDGFVFVTGRLKEAIVGANGDTISPEEIEPYYASSLFAESCVVPLEGPDGNDIATLVVVAASAEVSEADIQSAVATLRAAAPARYRVADVIRVPGPLPRTAIGKLQRRALAERLRGLSRQDKVLAS